MKRATESEKKPMIRRHIHFFGDVQGVGCEPHGWLSTGLFEAVGFYKHMGFEVVSRSPLDPQGKPFPILAMELR